MNCTPHPLNIVNAENVIFKAALRKYVSEEPEILRTIPKSGMVLSAGIETVPGNPVDGIPVFTKKIASCDPIPDEVDIVIVSALYVSAARAMGYDTSRLYTVADPVYSPDGKTIVGCLGICPAF